MPQIANLRRVGYDPLTSVVSIPEALPPDIIHGYGGACSDSERAESLAPAA